MTTRQHLSVFLAGWTIAVLACLAAYWAALNDRLPARVATHWSTSGPDQSMTGSAWLITILLITAVAATAAAITLATTDISTLSGGRRAFTTTMSSVGGFILGLQMTIIQSNLDVVDWREADTSWRIVMLMLLLPLITGALGWLLPIGPADQHSSPSPAATMDIAEGQHVAWSGRVTARWAVWLAATAFVILIVILALAGTGLVELFWPIPLALLLIVLAGALTTSVSVSVGQHGVLLRFGLFGWPVWRTRLDDIASATAEDHKALSLGGWGLRITPKGTAVMLRSGSCLVLHRKHRNRLFISIDNPEPAAALINGLIRRNQHSST